MTPDIDKALEIIMKTLATYSAAIRDLQERVEKLEMAYLRDHTHFERCQE